MSACAGMIPSTLILLLDGLMHLLLGRGSDSGVLREAKKWNDGIKKGPCP
jgi:hypothetical protein